MKIHRIPINLYILILLLCSLFSCDTFIESSVLSKILRKSKFRVTEISVQYPSRLNSYDVLFLQDLYKIPTESEIQNIQNFVKDGGTLIVSGGNHKTMAGLVAAYGLKLQNLPNRMEYVNSNHEEPFFTSNEVDRIQPRTYFAIVPEKRNMLTLYGTEQQAIVATLQDGEGRVYFTTSAHLFNGNGLKHSGNAALFYNLMSTLPRKAHIGLAERNYYAQSGTPTSAFIYFVFKTPWGLAAVYISLILFVFMTLRGRRFGQPLDVRANSRRLSTEYVYAMTVLYQKGNTRMDILRHIRDKFHTDLGSRWRVSPHLDMSTFLNELIQRSVEDKKGELTNLIRDLEVTENLSESQLVDLAKRVDSYSTNTNLRSTISR